MHALSVKSALRVMVVLALAAAALVAVAPGRAGAAGVPCQRTFSSGALGTAIPDPGQIIADIDVPEDGLVVSDIDVLVNIHHGFDQDLRVTLVSATDGNATRADARLFDRSGDFNDNILGTVFDDEASTPISWGDAPYTGRFVPSRPLKALDGFTGGKYRLVVADLEAGIAGTLDDWSITLRYASCDFDSDGVGDYSDSCLGVTAHTTTGCPLTTRAVSASYRKGKFKGYVSSPVAGCKASREVTIWKVRSGPDRKVGTATTRSDGFYRLFRAKHAGRYYATAPLVAVTDVAECPAVQSATFRVR